MDVKERATEVLETQREFVDSLRVDDAVVEAIGKLKEAGEESRRVVTSGMGKAGIIATKMSATLSSIGIPSFFLHPAEALHGDVGRVVAGDLLVVFSHSGRTAEVKGMLAALDRLNGGGNSVIYIGGNEAPEFRTDLVVCYGKVRESCVVGKVPSTSTTLMLVIADILAITAAEMLGLDDGWFKARHPGGAIGESYGKGK
ncbi:MAG: SIS domain-containing protein [Promethearchaeota archaeon]